MKSLGHHEVRVFEDGEVVVREGDESREMFVIRDGQIEVFKNLDGREVRLALLPRGSFFGEMSLLEGLPRSATARAVGPTSVLVLRPGSLLIQIRRDPTFAFELLQQMSSRIRDLNERLMVSAQNAGFARSVFMMSAESEFSPLSNGGSDRT